jgi:hypothetical protein
MDAQICRNAFTCLLFRLRSTNSFQIIFKNSVPISQENMLHIHYKDHWLMELSETGAIYSENACNMKRINALWAKCIFFLYVKADVKHSNNCALELRMRPMFTDCVCDPLIIEQIFSLVIKFYFEKYHLLRYNAV